MATHHHTAPSKYHNSWTCTQETEKRLPVLNTAGQCLGLRPDEDIIAMQLPGGFRLLASPPPKQGRALIKRCV